MYRLCILHRQPLDESDWLLTVFSRQTGKQQVITPRFRRQAQLDLNVVYEAGWKPDLDWPRIYAVNPLKHWDLRGDALLCGLYLNELLVRILAPSEVLPALYDRYEKTLSGLADGQHPEPWLRIFEYHLLAEMGYGFSWSSDSLGMPLNHLGRYDFELGRGLFQSPDGRYKAQWLLPLAGQGVPGAESWVCAKHILRQAIDSILDRPLHSRELFSWRNEER